MLRIILNSRRSIDWGKRLLCTKKEEEYKLPEEPSEGSCCGQGCNTCVWILYGEAVLRDSKNIPRDKLKKILVEKIKDPSIIQYVLMELGIK